MLDIMDMDLNSVSFEWDDNKEQANFTKHGIHFKTAIKVFHDPDRLVREDEEHTEELRYDILGKVGKILFVVCTVRESDTIRIISARVATSSEKERYYNGKDEI